MKLNDSEKMAATDAARWWRENVAIMPKVCENHAKFTDSREKNANRNMVSDMQGQVLNRKTIATNS